MNHKRQWVIHHAAIRVLNFRSDMSEATIDKEIRYFLRGAHSKQLSNNLTPRRMANFRRDVLAYMDILTE